MRAALLSLVLAACGGGSGATCDTNADCTGGDVCGRNGECLPASEVRTLRLTWTIGGQPASATTCANHPDLEVFFYSANDPDDSFGFSPVPCAAGVFTIDQLPARYTSAELDGIEKAITASDELAFDLPP
jgi:hypothetical protein